MFKVRFKVPIAVLLVGFVAGCSSDSPTDPSPGPNPTAPVVRHGPRRLGRARHRLERGVPAVHRVPERDGYVQVIARTLRNDGRAVTLTNLAIPAVVLSPDSEPRPAIRPVHPGQFSGGGAAVRLARLDARDDLRRCQRHERDWRRDRAGGGRREHRCVHGRSGPAVRVRVSTADRRDRSRAGQPRIVAANLPNFAGAPYAIDRYSIAKRQGLQTLSVRLVREAINTLTSEGIAVVDLMCDPRSHEAGPLLERRVPPERRGLRVHRGADAEGDQRDEVSRRRRTIARSCGWCRSAAPSAALKLGGPP